MNDHSEHAEERIGPVRWCETHKTNHGYLHPCEFYNTATLEKIREDEELFHAMLDRLAMRSR